MASNTCDKVNEIVQELYSSHFLSRIERIEKKIKYVDRATVETISALEEKKRVLRQQNDPNNIYHKQSERANRYFPNTADQQIPETTKRLSVDKLDRAIANIDREISFVQDQQDEAFTELQKGKETLKQRLSSIEKLDLLINVLTYKIFEAQHEHRQEMEELLHQREELINNGDLSENPTALALAELDKKISDIKNTHEATMISLEGQRTELRKETVLKTVHMDTIMESLTVQHNAILADLEDKKINATPSEIDEADRRIEELNRMFTNDVENLKRLQEEGWRQCDSQEKLSAMLESRGVRITPSGHFLTSSGHHLTRSEASCLGYLEGVDFGSWEDLLKRQSLDRSGDSDSAITQASSTVSSETRMASDDIYYLKTVLGKPLTLALAEITAKQPRDPIHYLGHWLFKYRYNQEVDDVKKQEIQKLISERERLEREKLHAMIEDEARTAVLNMVIRAEEEAIRNELERIAREAAMLEAEDEELEAEARDTLGVYGGPSAGNRMN